MGIPENHEIGYQNGIQNERTVNHMLHLHISPFTIKAPPLSLLPSEEKKCLMKKIKNKTEKNQMHRKRK